MLFPPLRGQRLQRNDIENSDSKPRWTGKKAHLIGWHIQGGASSLGRWPDTIIEEVWVCGPGEHSHPNFQRVSQPTALKKGTHTLTHDLPAPHPYNLSSIFWLSSKYWYDSFDNSMTTYFYCRDCNNKCVALFGTAYLTSHWWMWCTKTIL